MCNLVQDILTNATLKNFIELVSLVIDITITTLHGGFQEFLVIVLYKITQILPRKSFVRLIF